eukprot:gene6551-7594_t
MHCSKFGVCATTLPFRIKHTHDHFGQTCRELSSTIAVGGQCKQEVYIAFKTDSVITGLEQALVLYDLASLVPLQKSDNYQAIHVTYSVPRNATVQFDITVISNTVSQTITFNDTYTCQDEWFIPSYLTNITYFQYQSSLAGYSYGTIVSPNPGTQTCEYHPSLYACTATDTRSSSANLFRLELNPLALSNFQDFEQPVTIQMLNNGIGPHVSIPRPPVSTATPTTVINDIRHTYGNFGLSSSISIKSYLSFLASIDNLDSAVQFYEDETGDKASVLIPVKGTQASGLYTIYSTFRTKGSLLLYNNRVATGNTYAYTGLAPNGPLVQTTVLSTDVVPELYYAQLGIRMNSYFPINYTYAPTYPLQPLVYPLGVYFLYVDQQRIGYISGNGVSSILTYPVTPWPENLLSDTSPPILNSMTIRSIDSNTFIVRANISDDISGFDFMTLYNGNIIHSFDRIASHPAGDLYEVQCYLYPITQDPDILESHKVTLLDKAGNIAYLPFRTPYNTALDMIPYPPSYITFFEFALTSSDVSQSSAYGTLYMRTKIMDPLATPSLYFTDASGSYDMKKLNVGYYDASNDMYVIPFTIRAKLFSRSLAYILNTFTRIDAELLSTNPLIGSKAFLNIHSDYADEIGPLLVDISAPTEITLGNQDQTIGWTITIEDSPSGFLRGIAMVTSEFDRIGRNISFNAKNNIVTGNATLGTYRIEWLQHYKMRAQTFTLNLILYDTLGNVASDPRKYQYTPHPFVSPFINLNDTQLAQLSINVAPASPADDNIPSLSSFQVTKSTVAGISTLTVHIKVSSVSGIDMRFPPIFYLLTTRGRYLAVGTSPILLSPAPLSADYIASVKVPYSYAQEGVVYGLYGLTDIYSNIQGFDYKSGLLAFGNSPDMSIGALPVLQSCTEASELGGNVLLTGYNLGLVQSDVHVWIDPQGPIEQTITFHSASTIETIIVPDPVIDPTTPTIIIPIPDDDGASITEVISVVSLREFDITGKAINTFTFKNWTFTNETVDRVPTYLYTVTLPNRQTVVNVTAQYFRESTSEDTEDIVDTGLEVEAIHISLVVNIVGLESNIMDFSYNAPNIKSTNQTENTMLIIGNDFGVLESAVTLPTDISDTLITALEESSITATFKSTATLQKSVDNYQAFLITFTVTNDRTVQFDIIVSWGTVKQKITFNDTYTCQGTWFEDSYLANITYFPYFSSMAGYIYGTIVNPTVGTQYCQYYPNGYGCTAANTRSSLANFFRIEFDPSYLLNFKGFGEPVTIQMATGPKILITIPPLTQTPSTTIIDIKHTYGDFGLSSSVDFTSYLSFLASIDNLHSAVQFYDGYSSYKASVLIPVKGSPSRGMYTLYASFTTRGSLILYNNNVTTGNNYTYTGVDGVGAITLLSRTLFTNVVPELYYAQITLKQNFYFPINYTYATVYPLQPLVYPFGAYQMIVSSQGEVGNYMINVPQIYSKFLNTGVFRGYISGNGISREVNYDATPWPMNPPPLDIRAPILNSMTIRSIDSNTFIVRANISDDISGFDFMTLYNGNIIHSFDRIASHPAGDLYEILCYLYPITQDPD